MATEGQSSRIAAAERFWRNAAALSVLAVALAGCVSAPPPMPENAGKISQEQHSVKFLEPLYLCDHFTGHVLARFRSMAAVFAESFPRLYLPRLNGEQENRLPISLTSLRAPPPGRSWLWDLHGPPMTMRALRNLAPMRLSNSSRQTAERCFASLVRPFVSFVTSLIQNTTTTESTRCLNTILATCDWSRR